MLVSNRSNNTYYAFTSLDVTKQRGGQQWRILSVFFECIFNCVRNVIQSAELSSIGRQICARTAEAKIQAGRSKKISSRHSIVSQAVISKWRSLNMQK